MSNNVEIDASKSVEEGVENIDPSDTSDVYLGLFWRRATRDLISFQEFRDLAQTWLRILHLEMICGLEEETPHPPAEPAPSPQGEGIDYKKLYEDLVDSLLEEDVHPASGPEEVQIDQHTFVSQTDAGTSSALRAPSAPLSVGSADISPRRGESSPQGEGGEAEKKQKSAAKSAAGKASFARRKQAALEAVKSARASGCTLQGIADQSSLSLPKVLDLINGEPCPVTDWTKLEKGLKKLGHPPRVTPKEETDEQEEK